jgi:coenzyme Q-binding protein COQ10
MLIRSALRTPLSSRVTTTTRTTAPKVLYLANRRTFLNFPTNDAQELTASRTLPYDHTRLYDIIANVDSYSAFVPYCRESRVTRWSSPDKDGRRWPTQADLSVGFGALEESFTSKLVCVPGSSVEARSGTEVEALLTEQPSGFGRGRPSPPGGRSVFKSLVTKWTVQPAGGHQGSETSSALVDLVIRYQFANPLYSAVSAAVSDKMAAMMIEAFEQRARRILGNS